MKLWPFFATALLLLCVAQCGCRDFAVDAMEDEQQTRTVDAVRDSIEATSCKQGCPDA